MSDVHNLRSLLDEQYRLNVVSLSLLISLIYNDMLGGRDYETAVYLEENLKGLNAEILQLLVDDTKEES